MSSNKKEQDPLPAAHPICKAIKSGDVAAVTRLLDAGTDVNARVLGEYVQPYLLQMATVAGQVEVVRLLILRGATVDAPDYDSYTALHYAATHGHAEIAELLATHGALVDYGDSEYGRMPLHLAAGAGHAKVVQVLLSHGATVDVPEYSRWTALLFAAAGGHTTVAELLIAHGADVNATDYDGITPLHKFADDPVAARLLIEKGASATAKDKDGKTPLDRANTNTLRDILGGPSAANKKSDVSSEVSHPYKGEYFTIADDRLGAGSEGTVYKAFDNVTSKQVAVKCAQRCRGDSQSSFLAKEYEVLKNLHHPNIVRVLHFHVEVGRRSVEHQIFMEWMPSGSVSQLMRNVTGGSLSERSIWKFLHSALEGLAYLHGKSFLHRDIKPGNMLVDADGVLKLSDFGLTLELPGGAENSEAPTTQRAQGTWAYMAPEVFPPRGKYSTGSDMWALACSVVHMASGQIPWTEDDVAHEALPHHIKNAKTHPRIPGGLSDGLKEILETMFKPDWTQRGSAESFLAHSYFLEEPRVTPGGKSGPRDASSSSGGGGDRSTSTAESSSPSAYSVQTTTEVLTGQKVCAVMSPSSPVVDDFTAK